MSTKVTVTIDSFELTCEYWEGRAAQISGPPENCYPEEPAEVEILSGVYEKRAMTELETELLQGNSFFYGRLTAAIAEQLSDEYDAHQEAMAEDRKDRLRMREDD